MAEKAVERLQSAGLVDFVKGLGLAVADANKAMAEAPAGNRTIYTINQAEIEVKVAVNMEKKEVIGGAASVGFNVFSVNASYSRTYNFKEEAASSIRLVLAATPLEG